MGITREDVTSAYVLFFDRLPENNDVIDHWLNIAKTKNDLRLGFVNSEEYRRNNWTLRPSLTGKEARIRAQTDDELTTREISKLFDAVKFAWTNLGDSDPYWAVLSHDDFRDGTSMDTISRFYASGQEDIQFINVILHRNSLVLDSNSTVLEYGCGLGRVTSHFSRIYEKVIGVDISASMLKLAEKHFDEKGIKNVEFQLLLSPADIEHLPPCDLFYSAIVLQHSPPPIISLVIRNAIRALSKGGIAIFQVPTYLPKYDFVAANYISGADKKTFSASHGLYEIHAIRQPDLFRIIDEERGKLVEIFEDTRLGPAYQDGMSNTLVIRKA